MIAWLHVLIARIRAFFRASADDRELTRELDAHLAMAVEEHIRRGLTPDQARRLAHQELGGLTQLREAHRDVRGLPVIDAIRQDLRYALRTLRRDRGFTLFVLLIIGLGIGASATVFSVINALLDFGAMFAPGMRIDLFVPYPISMQTGGGNNVAIVGRLAPRVSIDRARVEFTARRASHIDSVLVLRGN